MNEERTLRVLAEAERDRAQRQRDGYKRSLYVVSIHSGSAEAIRQFARAVLEPIPEEGCLW